MFNKCEIFLRIKLPIILIFADYKVLQERSIPAYLVPTNDQDAIELIEDAHEVLKAAIVSDHNLTTAHLKNIGYKIETMLVSCYFDGTKCSTSDFTWFYSYK